MINTFQVGCDPEFVALDDKAKVINVARWNPEGEVGWDHTGRVIELRPKPCAGTFALVRRLQRLMKDEKLVKLAAKRFRAGASCAGEMLGGHVHFGVPILFKTTWPKGHFYTLPDGSNIPQEPLIELEDKLKGTLSALDKVTHLLQHLDILPLNESTNRRKGRYGKWGDIRDSGGHMEYRTMASWLYDPRVAFLCLTAAKLAAADPQGALDALKNVTSFEGLGKWIALYKSKDQNARRALEKVIDKGLKSVQVDPDVDFRERWEELGL